MQYSAILRAIDAELNKLLQVRAILASTIESATVIQRIRPKKRLVKRISSVTPGANKAVEATPVVTSIRLMPKTVNSAISITEPLVTVFPPKQKREYRRTIKPFVPEPRVLAAPRSSEVVVYMPPSIPKTVAIVPAGPQTGEQHGSSFARPLASPENLEAVMRQKLFGASA
jgi:hypothetical protein